MPSPSHTRHRDLLGHLSFRWPELCYLVATRRGNRALVVTEMSPSRSLARVASYSLATVNDCVAARWIELGPVRRIPPYFAGKPGDSLAGQSVVITSAGCVELGVPTPVQRQIAAARIGG